MSFDGIFLNKLIKEIEYCKTGRISKISESSETDFILTIRRERSNLNLMLSFSSDFARIHFTTKHFDTPKTPKSFTMLLRKHIEGYFIEDLYQYENDRVVVFKLAGYSEMKDYTHKYLICEIMGRYSNLILTDENYKIIEVLKKDGVGEFNRTMLPNATYEFPITDKVNPYKLTKDELLNIKVDNPKEMLAKFNGISLLLAESCFTNDFVMENFYNAINMQINPVIIRTKKGKKDFYFTPLNNEVIESYETISTLLDNYYYEADTAFKIKQKTNDLLSFINRQITKYQKKVIKLEQEINDSLLADEYKVMGELLLSYPHLKEKTDKVDVYNYYTNETQTITLDPKYDVITNSQKYYKKYQKAKSAIFYITEQIEKTKDEIEYFKVLLSQISNATLNDALEIKEELIENKYILATTSSKQTKKKRIELLTYIVDDVYISVGKNNLQNEYLTHKYAKPNEYWFHVKDAPGSHVVLHTENLTENLIRTSALLAASYSSISQSSSIPIDYTQVRNIKKIPGKRNCFVTYTKQKTIYIDPDYTKLSGLKVKK